VNGTRKQTKKEDENKLTTLAFKMIPIFHNTLLATTKINFFLGLLPIFGAHQPTHQPQFLWAQTQILLWRNLSFWGAHCRGCYLIKTQQTRDKHPLFFLLVNLSCALLFR
jgi:hypothetical protein